MVKLILVNDGIRPNSADSNGRTSLLLTAAAKQWQMDNSNFNAAFKLLFADDHDYTNSQDKIGRIPLLWAAGREHHERIKLLIAKDGLLCA